MPPNDLLFARCAVCFRYLRLYVRQVAHALAQGKVGSGFDVSSAALGSQRYVRVPAGTLRSYLDRLDTTDASAMLPVVTELADSRHSDWEYKVVRTALGARGRRRQSFV